MLVVTEILLIVLFVVSYNFLKWLQHHRTIVDKLKNIPGPNPIFLLGNTLDIQCCKDVLPSLMQYQNKYGLTFKAVFCGNHYVITADPAMIEYIVTSSEEITKTGIYKFMASWIGNGLICAGNPRWQRHRHIISPTFNFNVLQEFVPKFQQNAEQLIQHWKNTFTDQINELDVTEDIGACTLDIICDTAMGIPINALKDGKHSKYLDGIKFMGRTIVERSFNVFKHFDALYTLSSHYRKEKEFMTYIQQATDNVIKQKQSVAAENVNVNNNVNKSEPNDIGIGLRRHKAFLDHLFEVTNKNGSSLTDEELREEVHTFIFSGHDSAASCTSLTLYLLAAHPEIQEKVYNEVISVMNAGTDNVPEINYKMLSQLKYLHMVIKESLRLFPPAPLYMRKLTKDVMYNGVLLPKDINVAVFAYGAHRNPEIFKNPDEFDPERFTTKNISDRSPYAYVPFSAGPRNCIGQKFAILEIKCMISCLLREFKFAKPTDFEIQPVAAGVLKSINGVRLIIQPRKSNKTI